MSLLELQQQTEPHLQTIYSNTCVHEGILFAPVGWSLSAGNRTVHNYNCVLRFLTDHTCILYTEYTGRDGKKTYERASNARVHFFLAKVLSQKWGMLQFCALIAIFFWHFMTIYSALFYFLALLWHFWHLLALLACYIVLWRIHCRNLRTFLGKFILPQHCECNFFVFFHVCILLSWKVAYINNLWHCSKFSMACPDLVRNNTNTFLVCFFGVTPDTECMIRNFC